MCVQSLVAVAILLQELCFINGPEHVAWGSENSRFGHGYHVVGVLWMRNLAHVCIMTRMTCWQNFVWLWRHHVTSSSKSFKAHGRHDNVIVECQNFAHVIFKAWCVHVQSFITATICDQKLWPKTAQRSEKNLPYGNPVRDFLTPTTGMRFPGWYGYQIWHTDVFAQYKLTCKISSFYDVINFRHVGKSSELIFRMMTSWYEIFLLHHTCPWYDAFMCKVSTWLDSYIKSYEHFKF